jgi:hypothetical protein
VNAPESPPPAARLAGRPTDAMQLELLPDELVARLELRYVRVHLASWVRVTMRRQYAHGAFEEIGGAAGLT